ncbi:MAG: DUF350 domain-containing protein [Pirellulaceae bacterium]|jgi:uncharacterized membrane protein YjfL (UPF0719 family)|nr:DUF350 domain-containing protein [Pirellulaceae bacterium]MDP7015267.1 DUF350 domain-containing protein [Pirellulaceae bacterium]
MDQLKRFSVLALMFTMLMPATLMAQDDPGAMEVDWIRDLVVPAVLAIVFTVIGLILFGVCLILVVKLAPFSVRKEIEEDQNTSLGIIVGSMIIGIAIILAAALMG